MTVEQLPSQIKNDNWAFYVLARSDDPALKCMNVRNLVSNLKTTMKICEITEHDALLRRNHFGANTAWNQYVNHNRGYAVEIAMQVLDEISFLVYDKRFATPQTDSFKGRSDK